MRIVIAGAGLAAQRCAETLRANGHDGPITMVGAEPHAPYDRPPLSKAVLAGERPDLAFRPADVELITGTRVTRVTGSAHWEAAARQGAAAARAMLGLPKRADAPPIPARCVRRAAARSR